jgi:hypothetical protein
MMASLAPAQFASGDGGAFDASEIPIHKLFAFFVQVIWHYRNRGMPWRRGQSPRELQSILQ